MESFELEQVFRIFILPHILRLDKLLSLHLGLGVADFDVVAPWLTMFLVVFYIFVPVLQIGTGTLAKVVADDAIDRRLWPVGAPVGELLVGECDLHAALLKSVHAERNAVVMAFSEFVVLGCSHISFDNCLVIKQFEVSRVIRFRVVFWLVYFPGRANLGGTLLGLLVRPSIGKMLLRQSASRGLGLANVILDDHVVGLTAQYDIFSLADHS